MFHLMCEKKKFLQFHTLRGGVWTKSVKVHTFFFSSEKVLKNSCLSRLIDPCKALLYLPSSSITALHSRKIEGWWCKTFCSNGARLFLSCASSEIISKWCFCKFFARYQILSLKVGKSISWGWYSKTGIGQIHMRHM